MKGYPTKLNTKADYEYVRENFPAEEWKKDWQDLLDSEKDWVPTGEVESPEAGITDATHKVIEQTDGEEETVYIQCELQIIPTCRLLRLGFTEEEVKAALESSEVA